MPSTRRIYSKAEWLPCITVTSPFSFSQSGGTPDSLRVTSVNLSSNGIVQQLTTDNALSVSGGTDRTQYFQRKLAVLRGPKIGLVWAGGWGVPIGVC
mgnify:CR=1 FL=1